MSDTQIKMVVYSEFKLISLTAIAGLSLRLKASVQDIAHLANCRYAMVCDILRGTHLLKQYAW